jgi:hypothetical protein
MKDREASSTLYFQAHGLAVRPPEELNAALAEAIGTYAVAVPTRPSEEMSAAERAAFESLGIDVDDAGPAERDPMKGGAIALAKLVESALSVSEAAERLGVTPGRVHQRIKAAHIYSFRIDSRRYIPAFQFQSRELVPNIAEVNQAVPASLHPVAVARWFETSDPDLVDNDSEDPLSPLQWLLEGRDPARPARLAKALADHP